MQFIIFGPCSLLDSLIRAGLLLLPVSVKMLQIYAILTNVRCAKCAIEGKPVLIYRSCGDPNAANAYLVMLETKSRILT